MPGPSTGFDTDRIVRQLEDLQREAVAACATFVKGEGEGIMQRALELVPVEIGELASTTRRPSGSGSRRRTRLSSMSG